MTRNGDSREAQARRQARLLTQGCLTMKKRVRVERGAGE
jgi:hypothetical protein